MKEDLALLSIMGLLLTSIFAQPIGAQSHGFSGSANPVPNDAVTIDNIDIPNGEELGYLTGSKFNLNLGQIPDDRVIFHTTNAYFSVDGIHFRVTAQYPTDDPEQVEPFRSGKDKRTRSQVYEVSFEDSNLVVPKGMDLQPQRSNFFLGNDPSAWTTDVPSYDQIVYEGLYDGIDLVFKHVSGVLKYDIVVQPGADLGDVRFRYIGAEPTLMGDELLVRTGLGSVREGGLYTYQEYGGGRTEVRSRFVLDRDTVTFEADYEPTRTLVIDPVIFSTYLGGSAFDDIGNHGLVLDQSDNVVLTGSTLSPLFPTTPGAYNVTYNDSYEIYLTKLNMDGSGLVFSTFIGGSGDDYGNDVAIDDQGDIYVIGSSNSDGFPVTVGAYNSSFSSSKDVPVIKVNSTGDKLIWSALMGGDWADYGYAIAVDGSKDVYITGEAGPGDTFPTSPGAYGVIFHSYPEVFVAKLRSDGTNLIYSSILDDGSYTQGNGIAVDPLGNAYVTGSTQSDIFPTTSGSFDTTPNGNVDAFVTKINQDGSDLVYSTYIGGESWDGGQDIVLDSSNNAYFTGSTNTQGWSESPFPTTPGAYLEKHIGMDLFITKLAPDGSDLVFSTLVGGRNDEIGHSITLDSDNNVLVAGRVNSTDFPTTAGAMDPVKISLDWTDGFVLRLSSDGADLQFSSFMGGNREDSCDAVAMTSNGEFVMAGKTQSTDIETTPDAFMTASSGDGEVFIERIAIPRLPSPPENLTATGGIGFIQLDWESPLIGSGITNYVIYKGDGDDNISFFKTIDNQTSFNDTDVKNSYWIEYYYQVSAVNATGVGRKTKFVNETAGGPPYEIRLFYVYERKDYLNLTWYSPFENNGAFTESYNIYKGTEPDRLTLLLNLKDSSYKSGNYSYQNLVDMDVTNGVEYFYSISPLNYFGEGNMSEVLSGIPGDFPGRPMITAIVGADNIRLEWTLNDNGGMSILRYDIYRGESPDTIEYYNNTTSATFMDTNVTPAVTYYYYVKAVNVKGAGISSEIVSGMIPTVPSPPLNLTIRYGVGYVRINWLTPESTGGTPILGYRIYKGDGRENLTFLQDSDGYSYNDTDVISGYPHFYSVTAFNAIGVGPKSNIVNGTPTGIPGMVRGLTSSVDADFNIRLTWEIPLDGKENLDRFITGYKVYRGPNMNLISHFDNVMDRECTEYIDVTVEKGSTYLYYITAFNDVGEGDASNMVGETPSSVPGKPTRLNATFKDGAITLVWWAPNDTGGYDIEGFRIYRGTSIDNLSLLATKVGGSYTDTDGEDGQVYYYRVSAMNSLGEGPLSETASATVPSPAPDDPGGGAGSIPSLYLMVLIAVLLIVIAIITALVLLRRRGKRMQAKDFFKDEDSLQGPQPRRTPGPFPQTSPSTGPFTVPPPSYNAPAESGVRPPQYPPPNQYQGPPTTNGPDNMPPQT